jgi:UDP:flavonoid glycosyltransferase YjiC (YdhE family)
MKVLFVPINSQVSHIIPLLALEHKLRGTPIEAAFLLPANRHDLVRQSGARVLEVDHQSFRTEMKGYGMFSPDVVVDDCSLTTGYAAKLSRIPRITIQRTGIFPGGRPRNPLHRHSMVSDLSGIPDVTALGLKQPKTLSDLFQAALKIVPGIPSIEVLPPALRRDPSYFFAGPLLMDDVFLEDPNAGLTARNRSNGFGPLSAFFATNRGRKVVYFTLGTVQQASGPIFAAVRELLDHGVAVVASFEVTGLSEAQRSSFFAGGYLPSHFVCEHVDLVVHQCGSGTYHYPLLHGVPAVTVGTRCHDREDVALRLQELGVSMHVPAPEETPLFEQSLRQAVWRYLEGPEDFIDQARSRIQALKEEIDRTAAEFNFGAVLRSVLRGAQPDTARPAGLKPKLPGLRRGVRVGIRYTPAGSPTTRGLPLTGRQE